MMPSASAHFPLLSVEIKRESIPVETMSPAKVPDEKWRYVDSQGHGHFWQDGELPTLEWVVTGTEWVGDKYDASEVEIGEYRCRLCGVVVEPGKRVEYGPREIPGLTTVVVTVNGESFQLTEEQYAASVDAWLVALQKEKG